MFVRLGTDYGVNTENVSHLERMENGTLVYLVDGENFNTNLPFDTLIDLLNVDTRNKGELETAILGMAQANTQPRP